MGQIFMLWIIDFLIESFYLVSYVHDAICIEDIRYIWISADYIFLLLRVSGALEYFQHAM